MAIWKSQTTEKAKPAKPPEPFRWVDCGHLCSARDALCETCAAEKKSFENGRDLANKNNQKRVADLEREIINRNEELTALRARLDAKPAIGGTRVCRHCNTAVNIEWQQFNCPTCKGSERLDKNGNTIAIEPERRLPWIDLSSPASDPVINTMLGLALVGMCTVVGGGFAGIVSVLTHVCVHWVP